MNYNFFSPTQVLFGRGQINHLHEHLHLGKRALLVMSCGKSAKVNGTLTKVEDELKASNVNYYIFDKIMANPLKAIVEEGALCANQNNCDFVIALGGGSVMDAAKGIALSATNKGDLWDYVIGGTGKGLKVKSVPLPIVAITTTAGTGSEVDCVGVITNPITNEKMGLINKNLFPVLAIVDSTLMMSVPQRLTALQGFDALFHSTEGYISNKANYMSEMVQRAAIENIGKYLPRAVKNGNDIEARDAMAFANTMSGYSMVVAGCTSEHSLEHAMSAYHQDLPHGAGLIMISKEYYNYFIEKHVCDDRFITMAKMLGNTNATQAKDFITTLTALQKACGVADLKMSDYGIEVNELDKMADNARQTMERLFINDRIQLSHDDCVNIYKNSYR